MFSGRPCAKWQKVTWWSAVGGWLTENSTYSYMKQSQRIFDPERFVFSTSVAGINLKPKIELLITVICIYLGTYGTSS